jgi:hypothetical protein
MRNFDWLPFTPPPPVAFSDPSIFNLRPGGTTRGNWSIFRWEGWEEGCGYSRLQGGSPWLCRLRTIHSGTLNKYLNYTDLMLALWDPVNWRSSIIVVVGWYPTIPLEMFTGIVYEPPTDSPVWGIVWKMCTRERWDTDRPYDVVVKGCHTWAVHGDAYVVLVRFSPCRVVYWFGSPRHCPTQLVVMQVA